jgi:hypothetical protein
MPFASTALALISAALDGLALSFFAAGVFEPDGLGAVFLDADAFADALGADFAAVFEDFAAVFEVEDAADFVADALGVPAVFGVVSTAPVADTLALDAGVPVTEAVLGAPVAAFFVVLVSFF